MNSEQNNLYHFSTKRTWNNWCVFISKNSNASIRTKVILSFFYSTRLLLNHFSTICTWFYNCWIMVVSMFKIICNFQIIYSIIKSIVINVMNNLMWFKLPSNFLFNQKSRLFNRFLINGYVPSLFSYWPSQIGFSNIYRRF